MAFVELEKQEKKMLETGSTAATASGRIIESSEKFSYLLSHGDCCPSISFSVSLRLMINKSR